MYQSVFREWKVAAVFVGGICLFVGAYFAEGGGYEQLEFRRKEAPKVEAAPAAPAAQPAQPAAARFTSDEELAAAYAEPSEAAPTPSASGDAGQAPADPGAPPPAEAEAAPAPAPAPSVPAQQAP